MTRNSIQYRIIDVLANIRQAADEFQRPTNAVQLLAVSKTQPISAIEQAISAGLNAFGESYLQDALPKIQFFSAPVFKQYALQWHFIGPLQSNKTSKIAASFDWVHSIDRLAIAQRLSRQRPDNLPDLNICIQVNIDNSATKSGIKSEHCAQLAKQLSLLPKLKLRGLMTVPAGNADFLQQRHAFHQLHELFATLNLQGFNLDCLSMGMSGDYKAAIAEGSTLVRIGTDIFGTRNTNQA